MGDQAEVSNRSPARFTPKAIAIDTRPILSMKDTATRDGRNFGLIAGTALVVDSTIPA